MSPKKKPRKSSRRQVPPRKAKPAIRIKGGVRYDPQANGFVVIVHQWDNPDCRGEPSEWRHPDLFPTEDAALQFYKTAIRPALKEMMAGTAAKLPGAGFAHRELE